MALSEKQLEQRRQAGKARAAGFTPDHQRMAGKAAYAKLVQKYGKAGAMRILSEAIAARPLTEPECRFLDILAGMGVEVHTSYIVETPDRAYPVDAYVESKKIVFQVDGWYWHADADRQACDQAVDARMRAAGYTVVRIWDVTILEHPEEVHSLLETVLNPINLWA
jgi:hypothetical protein